MAFQPVPDTCYIFATFALADGQRAQFGVYSRNSLAPWDISQQNVIRGAVRDAIIANYLPALSNEIDFVEIGTRDMEAEFPVSTTEAIGPTAGGLVSPSLPANVSVRATFVGAPGGAPRRGGIYLMPPAESQVVGDLLSVEAQAALLAAVDAIAAAASTASAAHAIVSRYQGSTLVNFPDGTIRKVPTKRTPNAVTNTVPARRITRRTDSQRKRLGDLEPVS